MATNRRFSRGLELPAVLAAGLAIGIADARAQVQVGDPTTSSLPRLDVRRLPEGPAGVASEARSAVIDGTSNTLMIGGRLLLGNNGGIWRAAVWAWTQSASGVIGPVMLQDRGFGGTANSIVVNGQGGDDMLAIGGAVRDEAGTEFPAIWIESTGGELSDAALHVLPTPADRGGTVNRVAAGDVNNDGVVDIIACGSFAGSSGNERAAVWFASGADQFAIWITIALTPLVPGGGCTARDCYYKVELKDVMISSFQVVGEATDAAGNIHACVWTSDDLVGWNLLTLPDAGASGANSACERGGELVAGGEALGANGLLLPAIQIVSGDGAAVYRLLPLPGAGFERGRVNSIIAILIGLLAGGEVNEPDGASAAIWIAQDAQTAAIDLNRLPSNRPRDLRLSCVNCILPYVEQSNVVRWVGAGTGSGGAPHAVVGTIRGWGLN